MQASIYRRNYYLIRVNSENKFPTDQNREREIYSETARVINEMIGHVKALLLKANTLREELEAFDEENDELAEVDELIQGFRDFQKTLPLTFFSQYPLDNQMTGPFVLRLIKEMSYWRGSLVLLGPIIEDIDQSFQEQKKVNAENISLIYFMTVKRITTDSNDLFRKLRAKIAEEINHDQHEEIEKEPNIFLVPTFRQAHNNQHLKKFKEALVERMNDVIGLLYRDMDVASFEAVDHYITELAPEDNIDLLAKKELRRNKKLRKEMKAYRLVYAEFEGKKQRLEERKRLKRKKPSSPLLSLNKNNHLLSVAPSNKSLPNRNSKVLLPSIKSITKTGDGLIEQAPKKRKLSKQNKGSKLSNDKHKPLGSKYKQKKINMKLKL